MILSGNVEQRLVKRMQDGEKSAAREFYSHYADYLAGICSRYIGDEDDLKDVFQDALIHIFTHIGDFHYRGAGSLQAWVSKVMVNQSLKYLRTKQRHEFVQLDEVISEEVEDEEPPINDIPPNVIQQMLNCLPVGYRTVLNLYVFEGKSHREIAQMLGIKENSSASQLHRAKHQLAKMIKDYNDNNSPRL